MSGLSRRQPVNWLMAALALGAHLVFLLALGVAGKARTTDSPVGVSEAVLQVRLRPLSGQTDVMPAATPPAAAPAPVAAPSAPRPATTAPQPWLPIVGVEPPKYFLPNELSEKPHVIHDVTPDLNFLALPDMPLQTAVLRLHINELGDVDAVIVESSLLPDAAVPALVAAYGNLKFSPGRIGELAVKSQLKIEVRLETVTPGL